MLCRDILEFDELKKGLKLIAGERGLNRPIRWIYFADCMACVDDKTLFDSMIQGGELIVVTNVDLTQNEETILQMMRTADEKQAAGFIINVGQILESVRNLAEKLSMPLFEIDWCLHMVDLSLVICKSLIQEENDEHSLENILRKILFGNEENLEECIRLGYYYGTDFSCPCRMMIWMRNKKKNPGRAEPVVLEERLSELDRLVKRELRIHGIYRPLSIMHNGMLVVLIPADGDITMDLELICNRIRQTYGQNRTVSLAAGVSPVLESISMWRKGYEQALKAGIIYQLRNSEAAYELYNEADIFSLIMLAQDKEELQAFADKYLDKLREADSFQEGSLYETLKVYLDNGCSMSIAAEKLFIHRNTFRYRLNKIRNLLNLDLTDLDVCMKLKLAFYVQEYLEYRRLE